MPEEKYEELVEKFFNGKLTPKEKASLFTLLFENEEAKDYFKKSALLKEAVNSSERKLPKEIDNNILSTVKGKESVFKSLKSKNIIAYAVAVVSVVVALFFYSVAANYRSDMQRVRQMVEYQNKVLELLINSFPTVNVNEKLKSKITIYKKL